jgi:hypothetical protein
MLIFMDMVDMYLKKAEAKKKKPLKHMSDTCYMSILQVLNTNLSSVREKEKLNFLDTYLNYPTRVIGVPCEY